MDLKVLRGLINTDSDCQYLLKQQIIKTYDGRNLDYISLEWAINSLGKDPLDYWVNDCICRTFKPDKFTEEQILEYLKLKWMQVIILSKFLEKLIGGYKIDFTKNPNYKAYQGLCNLPAKGMIIPFGITYQFDTKITNSFMQYTLECRNNVDSNVNIEVEFIVPFQMIAIIDRDKFSSFKDFVFEQRNSHFKLHSYVIKNNEGIKSFDDTTDLRTNVNRFLSELFTTCLVEGILN